MHPLMCWDIVLSESFQRFHSSDANVLEVMKTEFGWNINFIPILRKRFDALVITDTQQKIHWTSKGFAQMTGYSSAFALHKKSSFFQGKESSELAKRKIREAFEQVRSTEVSIINYRKDRTSNHCNIEILPLLTRQNKLMHFLAIEKEIDPTRTL